MFVLSSLSKSRRHCPSFRTEGKFKQCIWTAFCALFNSTSLHLLIIIFLKIPLVFYKQLKTLLCRYRVAYFPERKKGRVMQLVTQWERKKQSARGMYYCPSLFGLGNQTTVFFSTMTDFANFLPLQHPFLAEEL